MIGPVEINFECKYLQDGLVRQSVFNACQLNASQTIKRIEREREKQIDETKGQRHGWKEL